MTKKNECRVVSDAITAVVPGFRHSCSSRTSRHNELRVLGSRVDEYCTAKNGRRTTTTLIPDQLYPICYRMKTKVIDKLLPPERPNPPGGSDRAAAATNNNTNAASNPGNTNAVAGNNNTNKQYHERGIKPRYTSRSRYCHWWRSPCSGCRRRDYVATDCKYKTRNILGSNRNSSSRNSSGE